MLCMNTDFFCFWQELIIKLNDAKAMAYIVFDEAHCISCLSHDYVLAYRNVAKLMNNVCPNVPKIALTGTATAEVIASMLQAKILSVL